MPADTRFPDANPVAAAAAIYIHWPFCLKKCPYCDFNSHVREKVDQADWRGALLEEINSFAATFPNLRATSIFFGGGTPSLMPPETVADVINTVKNVWGNFDRPQKGGIEVTLEANPSSIEAEKFRAYRAAGVNRLSVGIQSLRDDALKFLGRLHSANEAISALNVARETFDRVSFDLIYARPDQRLDDWQQELSQALVFDPSHLSLYQLTIEEGTAFYQQYHRGRFSLPDEDEAAALYDLTQDMTEAAGLPAYEVSNHARPGEESQHNLAYWKGDFYVGIGPGAHGRLPGPGTGAAIAHNQIKRPENWLSAVRETGHGMEDWFLVDARERAEEILMMGLRLKKGLSRARFERLTGFPLDALLSRSAVEDLTAGGYLAKSDSHIRLSDKGLPLLNHCLQLLLS